MTSGNDVSPAIAALFAEAAQDQQDGRLLDAARRARAILAREPRHAPSLHLLGVVADQAGHSRLALGLIERALEIDWLAAAYHASLAGVLRRLGHPHRAAAAYDSALSLAPDWPELQVQAAMLWRALGEPERAIEAFGAATRLRPDWAEAHLVLAQTAAEGGHLDRAALAFAEAARLRPDDPAAYTGLGLALKGLGQIETAVTAFTIATRLQPDDPRPLVNLGATLAALNRLDEAIVAYRAAIELDPGRVESHNNLAITLSNLGRHDEAIASFEAALAIRPDLAEAHGNLGNVLKTLWRFDAAIARYQTALALQPGQVTVRINLGIVFTLLGRHDEAFACFEAALAANPTPAEALTVQRSLLFCAVVRDDIDDHSVAALHQRFGRLYGGRGRLAAPARARPGGTERRLKIGYLSSDFRRHPVATNLLPILRAHDRARFEIHCYSLGARQDANTTVFQSLADGWHPMVDRSDEAIARQIAADQIDVLVILASRFDQNRPSIAGWRPAPVQISFLDIATTGMPEIDYIIADRRLLPRHSPEYFSERPLRLPQYYVADLPAPLPPLGPDRSGPPVFCCFNNPVRIGAVTLALWGRLLARCPDARLTLKYMGLYASAELRDRVLAGLTAAGARPDQIDLSVEQDDETSFLARYNQADFALDPVPVSGSTTSFQALAMGVPVITRTWPGRMSSRWTAAMLDRLDLPELIADSAESYLAIAAAAVDQVGLWRTRRAGIRARLTASPLCDGAGITRPLERLYHATWRRAVLREG